MRFRRARRRILGGSPVLACCIAMAPVLGCIGDPSDRPAPTTYATFERVDGGSAFEAYKLGHEWRTVLNPPAHRSARAVDIDADGAAAFRVLLNPAELHDDALGLLILVYGIETSESRESRGALERVVYHEMSNHEPGATYHDRRVTLLEAGAAARRSLEIYEVRGALQAHTLEGIQIPAKAALHFGMGIDGGAMAPYPLQARYTVTVRGVDGEAVVFDETLSPAEEDSVDVWHDRAADLSAYAGQRVSIRLATEVIAGEGAPDGAPPMLSPLVEMPHIRGAGARAPDAPPNVILISLDTVRADHLGAYGYERDTSPNLDAFAEDAFLFERAMAPSSWTTPSHASVFTGLHPLAHGAGAFHLAYRLVDEHRTLAELASEHGQMTAAFTEGGAVAGITGFAQGFDRYSDGTNDWHYQSAGETFGRAAAWLETVGNQPFFLFVHTYEPHLPYMAPEAYWRRFSDVEPVRDMALDLDKHAEHVVDWYDAEIAYTDFELGRFLDRVRALRLLENTLVVIFSDHGEEFQDRGLWGHGLTLYNEVLHVPLVVRLPGAHPPVGRSEQLVAVTDLFPTIVNALGWDAPTPRYAYDLAPIVRDAAYEREYVHSHLVQRDGIVQPASGPRVEWVLDALQTPTEKFIRGNYEWVRDRAAEGKRPEALYRGEFDEAFYELESDPGERVNRIRDHAESAAQLRTLLEQRRAELDAVYRAIVGGEQETYELTLEEQEGLAALGYL